MKDHYILSIICCVFGYSLATLPQLDNSIIYIEGSVIGFVLYITGSDWRNEEALSPNAFFLLLLPPIIFESGYNLHKGNFFANIFSILLFAVVGTVISAVFIGGGIYFLGQAQVIYNLTFTESFAFGSLISAVDPVATLAIFQAIKVDQILYMLVFGESMLNDAVSIVLTTAVLEYDQKTTFDHPSSAGESSTELSTLILLVNRFLFMFFGSAIIGTVAGLLSALLLKYVNLHNTPSLEYGIMLVFAYLPYSLTEGVHLSGIMAILFCGITMSHYTHYNLSAVTQVTVQQTFRTLSFIAVFRPKTYEKACVFAYLGMAPFTFPMVFQPAFISWSIILCLISRAFNIFPLSFLVNYFRDHKITKKMQFLMWFSGLRGAIAFALSIHTSFAASMTRRIIVTTTYCVVLFTTIVLGGSTMPLTAYLSKRKYAKSKRSRRKKRRNIPKSSSSNNFTLSKTIEMGSTVDSFSEMTEAESYEKRTGLKRLETEEGAENQVGLSNVARAWSGLARFDAQFLRPFFVRKFTQREKAENRTKLANLASQWYNAALNFDSEDDDEENLLTDDTNLSLSLDVIVNSASKNGSAGSKNKSSPKLNDSLIEDEISLA
uniref:Sodium/hydrogen exchanger n=1 Tax=Romanomermis culicivorax TaxID=13658 RepID=A0A915JXZ7_ROMCU